jgi:hypothetical protein
MPSLEEAKRVAENLTGWKRPDPETLLRLARAREPNLFRFNDDGETPNNPKWPLVIYRSPVDLRGEFDPAAIFEDLFASNGWTESWRDGVYDFLHFHTRTHEALGIARGTAQIEFGGVKGKRLQLKSRWPGLPSRRNRSPAHSRERRSPGRRGLSTIFWRLRRAEAVRSGPSKGCRGHRQGPATRERSGFRAEGSAPCALAVAPSPFIFSTVLVELPRRCRARSYCVLGQRRRSTAARARTLQRSWIACLSAVLAVYSP